MATDPNYSTADFLTNVLLRGTPGYLCAAYADRQRPRADGKPDFQEVFFAMPSQLDAALAWFAKQSGDPQRDAYFCAHLLRSQKRKKSFAMPLGACYADIDHDTIPDGVPQPTYIVESSAGRYQAYWKLADTLPPEDAERLNKRLAMACGADPSGYDLTQLLRVPGTVNYKPGRKKSPVRIVRSGTESYTAAELDAALPPLPEEPQTKQRDADEDEPPVRLDADGMAYWTGARQVKKADKQTDQSETLYHIGRLLAKAGATFRTIVAALEDRDVKLGFNKYTGRPQEFERIADKVTAETAATHSTASAETADTLNAADLFHMDFPDVEELLRDVLPTGTTVLSAKPKIGKSWMALDIALGVSSGLPVLGHVPLKTGSVLYLALEDNARRLQKRTLKVWSDHVQASNPFDAHDAFDDETVIDLSGIPPLPKKLYFKTAVPTLEKGGLDAIEQWRKAHPDAVLVIIDTLQRFREGTARGANQYEQDYKALAAIHSYGRAAGLSILVIHHNRKAESDDPLDLVSGTFGVIGAADTVLVLQRARGQADATMFVTGRDVENETGYALTFSQDSARWSILGDAADVLRSKEQNEVIDALRLAGEPLTPSEVAAMLGPNVPVNRIKQRLYSMSKATQPLIKSVGKGKYTHA